MATAIAAAAAAAAAAAGGPPPAVVFARSPALAAAGILDYNTTAHAKLFISASRSLYSSDDGKFDATSGRLRAFLYAIKERARTYGWDNILNVPINGLMKFLPDIYEEITIDDLTAHVEMYVDAEGRESQNDDQLYLCITSSITEDARNRLTLKEAEYTIRGVLSGVMALKILIGLAHVDTIATIITTKTNLRALDEYMLKVGSDIAQFNVYVQQQRSNLTARGVADEDLITDLFRGYAACSDKEFKAYIKNLRSRHEDGEIVLTTNDLMDKAFNKYHLMTERKEWNSPSEESQEIIALRAEVAEFKKNQATRKPRVSNEGTSNRQGGRGKPTWMTKASEQSDSHTKTVDKKEYHWCPKHKAWAATNQPSVAEWALTQKKHRSRQGHR